MRGNYKKQLLISFGVIGGSIALASLGMYFFSADLTRQADKIIFDQALIAKQNAALGVLARLKHDAPVAAQYTDAIKKLLPTHDDLIGFPQQLDALGAKYHLVVTNSFQGGNTPPGPGSPGSDGFALGLNGALPDITSFLRELEAESQAYLLSIDSFTLSNDGANYQLSAQGRVFSQ